MRTSASIIRRSPSVTWSEGPSRADVGRRRGRFAVTVVRLDVGSARPHGGSPSEFPGKGLGSRGGDLGAQAAFHVVSCGSGGLSESPQLPASVGVNGLAAFASMLRIPPSPPIQVSENKRLARSSFLTVPKSSFSPHLSLAGTLGNRRFSGTQVPDQPAPPLVRCQVILVDRRQFRSSGNPTTTGARTRAS